VVAQESRSGNSPSGRISVFNTDPEARARKRAERDAAAAQKAAEKEAAAARPSAQQAERKNRKDYEAYLKTPVGQAEAALQNGQRFFQFTAPLSTVSGKASVSVTPNRL
jgi:hypothetical protein